MHIPQTNVLKPRFDITKKAFFAVYKGTDIFVQGANKIEIMRRANMDV